MFELIVIHSKFIHIGRSITQGFDNKSLFLRMSLNFLCSFALFLAANYTHPWCIKPKVYSCRVIILLTKSGQMLMYMNRMNVEWVLWRTPLTHSFPQHFVVKSQDHSLPIKFHWDFSGCCIHFQPQKCFSDDYLWLSSRHLSPIGDFRILLCCGWPHIPLDSRIPNWSRTSTVN